MARTVIPDTGSVCRSVRITRDTTDSVRYDPQNQDSIRLPAILYAWSSLSKKGYPLRRIASSAIPVVPRKSPTAFVTSSTIWGTSSAQDNYSDEDMINHSRKNVRQSSSQLEHDDNYSHGDSHHAAETLSVVMLSVHYGPRTSVLQLHPRMHRFQG